MSLPTKSMFAALLGEIIHGVIEVITWKCFANRFHLFDFFDTETCSEHFIVHYPLQHTNAAAADAALEEIAICNSP